MATNNQQSYNQNYKLRYSQEIEILDTLEHQLNEAANNLDIDKMQNLIIDFERKFYSDLRMSSRQSFDILKAIAQQRIIELKKRKELLAQRQRELQATEDAYQKLQDIKKMVLSAKTTSELEKAKRKYEKWKNEIGKSRKIKFGWNYNKKIDNLKSAIEEGIGPEDAIKEFKTMIESASHSGGFENDSQIKNWMNKYPLNAFHEVYKKEVRDLTDKAFSLIKEPEESNPSETSKSLSNFIPGLILMSPTQAHAVNDLRKIMDKNSNNFRNILEWIYTYRNVSFSEAYRQAISTLIPKHYGLNLNKQYSIPTFYDNENLKNSEIKSLVKNTVINYFGILLCGNDLSTAKQHLIVDAYKYSQEDEVLSHLTQSEESVDTLKKAEDTADISIDYSENKNSTELTLSKDSSEKIIYDAEEDSHITQSIPLETASPEIEVEISTILPDIEFEEEALSISSAKSRKEFEEAKEDLSIEIANLRKYIEQLSISSTSLIKDNDNNKIIEESIIIEQKSSDSEITANFEDFAEASLEIPLNIPENANEETFDVTDNKIEPSIDDSGRIPAHDSETVIEESTLSYELTNDDIDNIEYVYFLAFPQIQKSITTENSNAEKKQNPELDIFESKTIDSQF